MELGGWIDGWMDKRLDIEALEAFVDIDSDTFDNPDYK